MILTTKVTQVFPRINMPGAEAEIKPPALSDFNEINCATSWILQHQMLKIWLRSVQKFLRYCHVRSKVGVFIQAGTFIRQNTVSTVVPWSVCFTGVRLVNRVVLILWRYLRYLWCREFFSYNAIWKNLVTRVYRQMEMIHIHVKMPHWCHAGCI